MTGWATSRSGGLWAWGCVLGVMTGGVQAVQPAQEQQGGFITHAIRPGESLQQIAQQYLAQPGQWLLLLPVNGLKAGEPLVPGAQLRIPARLLKPSAVQAQVEVVHGHPMRVIESASLAAVPPSSSGQTGVGGARSTPSAWRLAPGSNVGEGSRIEVPADGYLRLRLADGSVVHILAGADVELKRLRRRNNGGDFESVLDVRRGKVEADVSRQPRGRVFEIHAPGAVASVRGTRFGVSVDAHGQVDTYVSEGEVALRTTTDAFAGSVQQARLTAGQSAVIQSDGRLHVLAPDSDTDANFLHMAAAASAHE